MYIKQSKLILLLENIIIQTWLKLVDVEVVGATPTTMMLVKLRSS
jgi:hypothetical protein